MGSDDDDWLLHGSGDVDDVRAYFDHWATGYDDDLVDWAYDAPDVAARELLARLEPDASVLDAGCGTGLVGRALRRAGFGGPIHGIDVSEASLREATAADVYHSLAAADLQQPLTFADDSFGGLLCVGVMTYVPEVERCWREFARVVRAGGPIVVTQRDDLWDERACSTVIERLLADGTWSAADVSESRPYLPLNDEFADRVGVHYVVASVG